MGCKDAFDPVHLNISVGELLAREALYLDNRQWDQWLALYEKEAEYWIPAWDSALEYTTDPQREVSLIYYNTRQGLEDRVFRIRTEKSSASTPLPRTCHVVSNVLPELNADGTCSVSAKWVTHLLRNGKELSFFGQYDYLLAPANDGWIIRKKRTLVMNDRIPTVLDIYSV